MFTGICEQNSITKRFKGAKVHFSVQHFISLMYCNIFHGIAIKFAIGCTVSEFFSNLHPENYFNENSRVTCNKKPMS